MGNQIEERLDSLLTEYRDACPVPEDSPAFLPRLWQRIDAQRRLIRTARGWTSAYVTIAAIVCLLLALLISLETRVTNSSYVDVLDDQADSSSIAEPERNEAPVQQREGSPGGRKQYR